MLQLNNELFAFVEMHIVELQSYAYEQNMVDDDSEQYRQKITAVMLVARMCEISKAALLIMRAELNNEAHSIFRVFLDAYFVFGAICSDASNLKEYFATDFAARLKLINVAEKHNSELFSLVKERISTESKDELRDFVKSESIQEFKSFNFANKCGCDHIFDSIYRVCSASIHSAPRSLLSYVKADGDIITEVNFNPPAEDITAIASQLSHFLIKVYSGLTEVFGSFDQEAIDEKMKQLDDLQVEFGWPVGNV